MASPSSSSTTIATAVVVLLLLSVLFPHISGTGDCPRRQETGPPTALYIFGDSFLDSGNNNYINTSTLDRANFWPYGETFFKFPTGRFSNGRLASDFIAQYAELPLIPPFLQPGKKRYETGANFASAGAGALVETFRGFVINLRTQLIYYKKVERWLRRKLGKVEAKTTLSRAVYLFSIGSNDYTSPFLINSTLLNSYPKPEYVQMVIGNLTLAIREVYRRGGRRFGFINLGDLGCVPAMRVLEPKGNGRCLGEASELSQLHNVALSKMLSNLEKQLLGFRYSLYDFNRILRQRMNHPSKYGFREGKTACCGIGSFRGTFSCGGRRPVKEFELCNNPKEFVFWDSFHLTEHFYKQMADEMWAGGPHAVKPRNLRDLFNCFN
ncbi:hypothetical protein NMG60_11003997 [Bertholletia excelsa]